MFSASAIACIALVATLAPISAATATNDVASLPILEPRTQAPTVAGAPFFPSPVRTDLVLARLDAKTQLDALELAQEALDRRIEESGNVQEAEETVRILQARFERLERELMAIEGAAQPLIAETEQFGISGFSVFPVASLRKPFWNDWHRPRSGGRVHKGNDMLAQTGVELRAIEDGYVERTSNGGLGGISIYLIGDSGSRYFYAHLDELAAFEVDERVYAGQRVGTVGDTGNATGAPHLHLQWDRNGGTNWENPFPLMDTLFGEGAAGEVLAELPPGAPSRDAGTELLFDADADIVPDEIQSGDQD